MAIHKKKLRVVLQRRGQHWIAKAEDPLNLSASGHNTRTARRLILAAIQECHGDVDVDVEIVLPGPQAATVQQYRHADETLRQLVKQVPKSRLHCAETLLAMNLSQGEVADLLGMSRGHLAVMLKRAEDTKASPPRRSPSRKSS
jgi:hypothetical protein